jgi:prepilin-type N-terminal cleavage/methylation domain-containing protein
MQRPRGTRGFTLIELLVAVGLMALLTAVFLPRLGGVFRFEIRAAARAVAGDLGYASQRAVATGTVHRWVFDLSQQAFRLEQLRINEPPSYSELPTHAGLLDLTAPVATVELIAVENRWGEWRWLEQRGVRIERILVGDEDRRAGTAHIDFGPDGGADPAELVLVDDGGHKLRVIVIAFTGEVRVEEAEGA